MVKRKTKPKFEKGDRVHFVGGGYQGGRGIILGKNKYGSGYDVYVEAMPSKIVTRRTRSGDTRKVRLASSGTYYGLPAKWIKKGISGV